MCRPFLPRDQVGGPSQQQAAVYEEFARCLPGFLPSSPSPGSKDASYGKAEVRIVALVFV